MTKSFDDSLIIVRKILKNFKNNFQIIEQFPKSIDSDPPQKKTNIRFTRKRLYIDNFNVENNNKKEKRNTFPRSKARETKDDIDPNLTFGDT